MNRKTLTFGLSLLLSFAVWTVGKLTTVYEDTTGIKLKFYNLPPATRLPLDYEKEINVVLLAKGYVFILNRVFGSTMDVDLSEVLIIKNKHNYLSSKFLTTQIQSKFPKGTKIIHLSDDELEVELEKIKFKTITIKINPESNLPEGYFFVHPPKIFPPEITATGPDDELAKLTQITTEAIDFKTKLKANQFSTNLILPKKSKLSFSAKQVLVEQEIDRFTEISQEIELQSINFPKSSDLILLPDKINITYKLGFKSAGKLKSNPTAVFVDYNQSPQNQSEYMIYVDKLPEYITSVQLNPLKAKVYIKQKSKLR